MPHRSGLSAATPPPPAPPRRLANIGRPSAQQALASFRSACRVRIASRTSFRRGNALRRCVAFTCRPCRRWVPGCSSAWRAAGPSAASTSSCPSITSPRPSLRRPRSPNFSGSADLSALRNPLTSAKPPGFTERLRRSFPWTFPMSRRGGRIRLHRGLVQHQASSLAAGLRLVDRVRKEALDFSLAA